MSTRTYCMSFTCIGVTRTLPAQNIMSTVFPQLLRYVDSAVLKGRCVNELNPLAPISLEMLKICFDILTITAHKQPKDVATRCVF